LHVIGMIFIGHAQSGKAPCILHVWIEGKIVGGDGQRSGMTENLHSAREILLQCFLELFSPSRRAGWQPVQGKAYGGEIEACIEPSAAIKSQFLCVQFVEVMKDAADCG